MFITRVNQSLHESEYVVSVDDTQMLTANEIGF